MGASGFHENPMSPVVFWGGTNVPSVRRVFAPGASATGFDMELYCTANWRKWHPVIVERAVVIVVC